MRRIWMIPSDAGVSPSRSWRVQKQMWIVNDVEEFESIRKQVVIIRSAREHLKDWKTGIIDRSLIARWLDIVYEWNIMEWWNESSGTGTCDPLWSGDPDPSWSCLIILGSRSVMTFLWMNLLTMDVGWNPLQQRQAVHWWARFWFQGLCFSQVLFRWGRKNREPQDIRKLKELQG